jgi:hypothetical protein
LLLADIAVTITGAKARPAVKLLRGAEAPLFHAATQFPTIFRKL